LIARMRGAGLALAPTLKLWTWELERKESDPALVDRFLELACRQLGAFAAAGGPVLFGTDVGYMDDDDPRAEFLLMQQAGLDWRAILAALTTAPAARLGGEPSGGRITAGAPADLVLLDARPDRDVEAFARVRACWRAGEQLHPRD
jgi:imidazolonepropionase-like amidohydrolase